MRLMLVMLNYNHNRYDNRPFGSALTHRPVMPVMILFPTEKESASLPYSFPDELFDAEFLTKMLIA